MEPNELTPETHEALARGLRARIAELEQTVAAQQRWIEELREALAALTGPEPHDHGVHVPGGIWTAEVQMRRPKNVPVAKEEEITC